MRLNMVGAFRRNFPFGTEIAFKKGLERIGVSVNAVDPSFDDQSFDIDADATVVFKWMDSYLDQLNACRGLKILYQPDDARFPHIQSMIEQMKKYTDLFLSFDRNSAKIALDLGYKAAETLLLTADDELYSPSSTDVDRDIDISFVGSLVGPVTHASRREMCELVFQKSQRDGLVTWFGTTENIPAILDIYRRSKIVLNHATDVGQRFGTGYGLQCRHFEVGMTRTALLSNDLTDESWDLPFVRFDSKESLLLAVDWLLAGRWRQYGQWLYDDIRERHLPQHRAVQLVDFIVRHS